MKKEILFALLIVLFTATATIASSNPQFYQKGPDVIELLSDVDLSKTNFSSLMKADGWKKVTALPDPIESFTKVTVRELSPSIVLQFNQLDTVAGNAIKKILGETHPR